MSLLTPLASPPAGPQPAPPGLARLVGVDRPDMPVPAVARSQPPRPAVDERPQRVEPREAGRRQAHAKGSAERPPHRPHAPDAAPEDLAPGSGLAVFLVQMFGQDRDRAAHGLSGHRDAAALGSDAYRRAGGAPPVFSEEPAVFRITA